MNLISIDGASKTLGDSPLFEDLSLGVDEGDRIGLVGRNGAGKSTLLRMLSGSLEPDSGALARKRGLQVSVLPQRPSFRPGTSLRGFLLEGEAPEIALLRAYERLVAAGASSPASGQAAEAHERELERTHRALEESGALDLERRYASYCSELGLADLEAPMESLSGGMVKKAALARCLAPRSDLVLLDEPTNHLDVETIEWLERRLLASKTAFVLVTHDRWFLDAVSSSILEIERGRVYRHPGNYSAYLERKAERWASMEKADSRRLANLKIELEWLHRGARARAGKSRRRKELIRGMEGESLDRGASMDAFSSLESRLGRKIIEFKDVSKGYGAKKVIEGLSYEFSKGDRVGVVGPNGAGKTTLLDLAAGRLEPDSGSVARGDTLKVAYFDQTGESLDRTKSVVDFVKEKAELIRRADGTVLTAEQLLERFLFPREFQKLALSRLSGGEFRRLQLVRLLAESPNFLILDEPTNDLDIETIELLEDFLEGFQGCVLTVSHDRAFLDRVADFLVVLDGKGGSREFPGSYGEWRELEAEAAAEAAAQASRAAESARRREADEGRAGSEDGAAPAGGARKKLSFAERREFESILPELEALEEEKAALEALFSAAAADPSALKAANLRYAELSPLIEAKTARWEELAERA